MWSQNDSFCAVPGCCWSSAGQQTAPLPEERAAFSGPPGRRAVVWLPAPLTSAPPCPRQLRTWAPLFPASSPPLASRLWDHHAIHHVTSLTSFPTRHRLVPRSTPDFFRKMRLGPRGVPLEGHLPPLLSRRERALAQT